MRKKTAPPVITSGAEKLNLLGVVPKGLLFYR